VLTRDTRRVPHHRRSGWRPALGVILIACGAVLVAYRAW